MQLPLRHPYFAARIWRKAAGTDQEGTAAGSCDCNDIWSADRAGADLRRTHAVDDLCEKSAADVLDASGKYLRCLGYFFWSLGILNVSRMVTQGLGYSGRAVLSGVTEMVARTIVSLGFVGALGYTAICFAIRRHGSQHAVT